MRIAIAAIVVSAMLAQGCGHPQHGTGNEPLKPGEKSAWTASNNVSANSFFGAVNIRTAPNLCAGRIQLEQGSATVKDSCFTGDTNVVLCTDSTAASAIRCASGVGNLQLTGSGNDLINYARVR
jgi:hypothetical protein